MTLSTFGNTTQSLTKSMEEDMKLGKLHKGTNTLTRACWSHLFYQTLGHEASDSKQLPNIALGIYSTCL